MNVARLQTSLPSVTLEEVSESIVDGPFGSNMKTSDYVEAGVPVLQGKNITGNRFVWKEVRYISDEKARELKRSSTVVGDHLLIKIGSIGYSAILDDLDGHDFAIIPANLARIRPDRSVVDDQYLHRVLTSDLVVRHFQKVASKTAQPALSLKKIKATEIPLPPLAEQKRIAGILDAADALRAKRRESLAQLDTLLQSTFLDMFGDPVTNPMGWRMEALGNLLDNIDSGWSPKCLDRKALEDEWGVLKLGAVTWCEFDEAEQKALPQHETPRPDIEVAAGDLLFTRKNTHDLVAAVAYVHRVRSRLMLPDLIFRLRLKREAKIDPKFLWQLLAQPHQRQSVQQLAGGAAGSMPNISKAKLKGVHLIKPPLDLQHRFAAIVESVEQQKASQRAHLEELDTLFASLQSRAFQGEL